MPKYLIEASYSAQGAKGLIKRGGTVRRAEVQKMVEGLGGRPGCFLFCVRGQFTVSRPSSPSV